mmetsp:Transcript_22963/g.35433  ORF Transcript_22963/g.35433 Transcript_22963/m.35433 type:complete len:108 (-) Transcript_22963:16-339(-)
MEHVFDLKHLRDVKEEICTVDGSWLHNLFIDGKKYWDMDELTPQRQQPMSELDELIVLPSDWRYREDLIWLKYGYQSIAQQWKVRLEVQQRWDRAQRNKWKKKTGRA